MSPRHLGGPFFLAIYCVAILISCSILTVGPTALAQDADIEKMMAEVSQLSAKQRELSNQLDQSLSLKRQNEERYRQLDAENNNLKAQA